jgi:hypothetical protein
MNVEIRTCCHRVSSWGILLVAALSLCCAGKSGAGTEVSESPQDGSLSPDGAASPDRVASLDIAGSPDRYSEEVVVPVVSTCVSCHTDKARLMELAPKEEPEEEEGGGG